MQRKEEQTAEISVVDEAGRGGTVYEYTTFSAHVPADGSGTRWLAGSKRYEFEGLHCNVQRDGSYLTVPDNKILRRG